MYHMTHITLTRSVLGFIDADFCELLPWPEMASLHPKDRFEEPQLHMPVDAENGPPLEAGLVIYWSSGSTRRRSDDSLVGLATRRHQRGYVSESTPANVTIANIRRRSPPIHEESSSYRLPPPPEYFQPRFERPHQYDVDSIVLRGQEQDTLRVVGHMTHHVSHTHR
jgi:hypothetical protein